ncbi:MULTISPECIES: hypothetical protein [unclassified Nostoc]|uniref:hypothetical protein n=1 Tax=unclassified Nostoc TaxID=2593658 RepID=UPI002AD277C5|nr:hypothetical protein [Nostoc sp. ChiQUE02]MDZ8234094.1 hypothetical protein [Nostoc sp. ChiQUE02]
MQPSSILETSNPCLPTPFIPQFKRSRSASRREETKRSQIYYVFCSILLASCSGAMTERCKLAAE